MDGMQDVLTEVSTKLTECIEECYPMLTATFPEELVISMIGGAMLHAQVTVHDERVRE